MNKISGFALAVTALMAFAAGFGVNELSSRDPGGEPPTTSQEGTVGTSAEGRGVAEVQSRLEQTERELAEARCALGSSGGINAYHDGDYALAIQLYDEALRCDAGDGYVLGLKAYSLFKTGDLEAAIVTQRSSLEDQPEHALGYLNLARFLCATGEFEAAAAEVATAISLWPDVEEIAAEDGEYQKLCQGRAIP